MAFDQQPEVSDERLLALYASGDRAAARDLTLRLAPRVLRYATRLLGDRAEAEDVAQEAMLRLWKVAADWRPGEAQVSTWLYRVTAANPSVNIRGGATHIFLYSKACISRSVKFKGSNGQFSMRKIGHCGASGNDRATGMRRRPRTLSPGDECDSPPRTAGAADSAPSTR